jgi:curli production assembly/transport component CsgF
MLFWAGITGATELVYTPVNPSFGGNPLNGTYLLGSAGAQNKFKDTSQLSLATASGQTDPVQSFKDQLNRRILSGLADRLVNNAFGEQGLTTGDYTMGDFSVHVDVSDPTNTSVTIFDKGTGNTTNIQIPTL